MFLSEREVGVSAGWHGTGSWYGGDKGGSEGSAGGSGDVSRRSVEREPCLRTRLRCESASLSSPNCFSHLEKGAYQDDKEKRMRRDAPQHRTDVRLVGNVYDPCLDCVGMGQ